MPCHRPCMTLSQNVSGTSIQNNETAMRKTVATASILAFWVCISKSEDRSFGGGKAFVLD